MARNIPKFVSFGEWTDASLTLVQLDRWSDIWNCQGHVSNIWWCGNTSKAIACVTTVQNQSLTQSFLPYPKGTALNIAHSRSTTFMYSTAPTHTVSVDDPRGVPGHSSKKAIAYGVGLGLPLGLVVVGFLGFLSSRIWRRHRRVETSANESQSRAPEGLSEIKDGGEIPDTQLLRELDPAVTMVEMSCPTPPKVASTPRAQTPEEVSSPRIVFKVQY